jgi:polygalacturonase
MVAAALSSGLMVFGSNRWTRVLAAEPRKPVRRNITEFGAVGDGARINSVAIQRAIDAVAASGGGTVEVPKGTFVTGTLLIRSHVQLYLAEGAVLQGSLNPSDYRPVDAFTDAVDVVRGFALLAAMDAENVGIAGSGTVDGRGEELQKHGTGPESKPFLVRWVRCTKVRVSGVTLKNSGAWTMHSYRSNDLDYRNLHIFSYGVENNDGLDIDSCEQVRVDGCLVESQDDAICLKTTSTQPCRDVKVTNCTVRTDHGALKIGTESLGDFEDIEFSHCHVIDAREGAIKFCCEDGANLRRVRVADITVDLADTPIFLRLGGRMRTYRSGDPILPVGSMSGITLENIQVMDATRVGVLISGFPDHLLSDVKLTNVSIKLKGEINASSEGDLVLPEQVKAYPEVWMFGPLIPAYGAFVRHASGVRFKNVTLKVELPDARPALICDDTHHSTFEQIQLTGNPHPDWVVTLKDSSDVAVNGLTLSAAPRVAVRIEGAGSHGVRLEHLGLQEGLTPYQLESGAPPPDAG